MTTQTPEIAQVICDACGGSLADGHQKRDYGKRDETGYQDFELICAACALERDEALEFYPGDEDARYEAADLAYDMQEGF